MLLPRARAACTREPVPPDEEEGVKRLKREVQADTKRVDRRLGRVLTLQKKNGMERRMKKSMEGDTSGSCVKYF